MRALSMRKFNITGKIIPEKHYYVDLTPQIRKLMALANDGTYFVINRPRQFGKTTLLDFFARRLQASKDYAPALLSFESFVQRTDITEIEFYTEVSELIAKELNRVITISSENQHIATTIINTRRNFFNWLGGICERLSQKLVLLIDEIDAVPETSAIGFLAGLREMYLARDRAPAPYSVCLAGVHDIKNLKARYRDETQSIGSTSPFNIAIDYELPAFSRKNIRQYFMQHTADTAQPFDEEAIDRVHHVTGGHPWLVSMLAKLLVENIVQKRKRRIQLEHVETAIQKLLASRNPNFESLFKNARNPQFFPVVLDLLKGQRSRYNIQRDDIDLGVKYGIFAEKGGQLVIANLIYVQALFQHFEEDIKDSEVGEIVAGNRLTDKRGRLDFQRVLDKFQAFMQTKGAGVSKHPEFEEAFGQLLLLSYLDLLANGKGWTFKEVQSGEGRIDVLCCYKKQKEVVELKLWYGERRYEAGLNQLAKYLGNESLGHGYLVVFDRREAASKEYSFKEHKVSGKKILAWVV
jgi:hypothetical protein